MNEIELTPKQIVAELDKYIVGQGEAKKSVAIALRNRWRRKRLSEDMQNEIIPKNILLIGPTGVGKTEIARRLHTILEKILENVAYEAPDIETKHIVIDKAFVADKLNDVVQNVDLSHYIL